MADIIGIDEAGRGPLAGPVAVGMVKIRADFDMSFFEGIKDSKKLSERVREKWFTKAREWKSEKRIDFTVELVSEKVIDKRGIVYAIKFGMNKCLEKLEAKVGDKIFLDGSLSAPVEFINQETIIKGDEKVAVISLASICAKVTRDKYMKNLGEKYPDYKFEVHKGYGTKAHYDAIKKNGLTESHRRSFLKDLTKCNKV